MEIVGKTMKAEPVSVPCRQGAAKRVAARGPLVFLRIDSAVVSERESSAAHAR